MSDWTEKYRPRTLDEVVGNPSAVNALRNWARQWEKGMPQYRAAVLMGSPGIGKTTSALALAGEMGWDTLEMNASDQRTGKDIEQIALRGSRFNTFGEDGSYMPASEGKRKLIILDEADNFFGNADRGAMAAVNDLIRTTRQPVILIVNDFYELSRKSSAVKNGTVQIAFKKSAASSMSKALYKIAEAEGISVEPEAMELIVANASGDMRAAVRNLQSLAEGADSVTAEMAQGLSRRDSRKDMYDLMSAVFRKNDPASARRVMMEVDTDPETAELWVDENLPYEYPDRGDLVRGYEALSRADIYLSRVRRRQYYRFWSYAGDMMTMGVANARMSDRGSRERIRFPMYLSKMSKSKSARALKKSVVYKMAVAYHTSTKRAASDMLPYVRSMMANDPEIRIPLSEAMGLEPEETAFLLDAKPDSAAVKKIHKEIEERAESRRILSQTARPSAASMAAVRTAEKSAEETDAPAQKPAPAKAPKKKAETEDPPKTGGQRSLFDF